MEVYKNIPGMTQRRGIPLGRTRSIAPVNMNNFFTWTLVLHVLLSSFSLSSQAFHRSPPRSLRTASSLSSRRGRLRPSGVKGLGLQAVAPCSGVKNGNYGGYGGTSGGCGGADGGRQRKDGREPDLSITTFNVLAPIFKRVGAGRESEFRDSYLERHSAILEHLKVRVSCV